MTANSVDALLLCPPREIDSLKKRVRDVLCDDMMQRYRVRLTKRVAWSTKLLECRQDLCFRSSPPHGMFA